MTIPTPEEVGALITSARPYARALFALCAFAGLRLGEAAGVQLSDVDFVSRRLRVTRQVQKGPAGAVVVSLPKYGSERVVYLADGLLELLQQHLDVHGTAGEERWLFAASDLPPQQDSVGYWWREALRAAGLKGIKLHDLRHFYASGLIAAGCDVASVQNALGHTKPTTTLNTYAHLWPGSEDRTRAAIGWFAGDGKYDVDNANAGLAESNYYNRDLYREQFRAIFEALRADGLFKHTITEIENSDLFKLSPFKTLNDDQRDAVLHMLEQLFQDLRTGQSSTAVIQGQPGTGKTVIGIYLMKLLSDIRRAAPVDGSDSDAVFAGFSTGA